MSRAVHVGEVLATLYQRLGIDANKTTVRDLSGRPQYLVDQHQPLAELCSYIVAGFFFWAHPDRRLELIPAPQKAPSR